MQQIVHPRSSPNGYDHVKVERDTLSRSDDKFETGKTNSSGASFGKGGRPESSSHDRLIYVTTCLIGHQVEIQLLDGSVYSGIFHSTNAENLGIVLKMAHLIKDGSQGRKNISELPVRTLVILPEDLVQVKAKGVPMTMDGLTIELQQEKQLELMTDSCISQSRHAEKGRELERWIPDEDDPACPELESTFDAPWNRGWDQFEANATLFGVKSTFNEEFYTTKLPRGPQMRELERKAERIAREIVGEETHDLHLAEERGIQLLGNLDIDEETRYSSVSRRVDDSGCHEVEDILVDSRNDETFGGVSSSVIGKPPMGASTGKTGDRTNDSAKYSSKGESQSYMTAVSRDAHHSGSVDHGRQRMAKQKPQESSVIDTSRSNDSQSSGHAKGSYSNDDKEKQMILDQGEASKAEDLYLTLKSKKESSDGIALSPNAAAFDPVCTSSKTQEKLTSSNELSEGALPPKTQGTVSSLVRPSSSASSTSDRGGVTSTSAGRGLSSSSSASSLPSEKSTLNPHAKEFKLNPNAKSFTPSQTPLRASSPVADNSYYYPPNMVSMTQMHGMSIPPYSAQQPVLFNAQAPSMHPPYYQPNGPLYGQQVMYGQPRPFFYMPGYPAEMPYKGREY